MRRSLPLLVFAVATTAWALLELATGADAGFLYLAPALLMVLPLLWGRYVGEERLAALAGRRDAPATLRPQASVPLPRAHARVLFRGGRLVGSSLAKRPPPAVAPSLA